jgi:hypothetical protein
MRTLSVGRGLGALALVVGVQGLTGLQSGVATGQVRTDPQAGSPAGVIYQIPLDSGRRDAAPVLPVGSRHGGSAGGGAGGTGGGGPPTGSGGSSASGSGASETSGAQAGSAGAGASATGGGAATSGAAGQGSGGESASVASTGEGTASDPSSIHSENGFGSSSQVPGVSPAAAGIGAGVVAAHTAGSTLPGYLLIVLIALAAIAVGLLASRTRGEPQ